MIKQSFNYFFVGVLFTLMVCCTSNVSNEHDNTTILEIVQNGGSDLTRDSLRTLKENVYQYISGDEMSSNQGAQAQLLYEMGLLLDRNRSFSESAKIFKDIVVDYPNTDWSEKALYTLINTYKVKVKSPQVTETLSALLLSKNPNYEKKEELDGNIRDNFNGINQALEQLQNQALYEKEGEMKVDRIKADEFIFLSQVNAAMRPKDERSKNYLDRSSEFARSIVNNEELLDVLNLLIQLYPNSKEGQQALFLKAFHVENILKDKQSAKSLYEEFLKKFPDNGFAKDAQFLLRNIDKTEEEILREFEQKMKAEK